MRHSRRKVLKAGAALAAVSALPRRAFAQAGPIRIGMSMPQTGSLGAGGQAALVALRLWVDDVNQRGGLLHHQRREGVVLELQSAGLELPREYDLIAPNGQMSSGALLARQLLNVSERPTAIICFNDMQAIGVMQTLQQANMRITEDISVSGYDDIPLAEFTYPALTTYCQPIWELGQMAARMALNLLGEDVDEALASESVITMRGELIVRRSTASPVSS